MSDRQAIKELLEILNILYTENPDDKLIHRALFLLHWQAGNKN